MTARHSEKWHLAKAPKWSGVQNTVRTDQCRAWLYLHGYIADGENQRIKKKLEQDRAQSGVVKAEAPA